MKLDTLEGSFSAVSKPIFASKYLCENSRRTCPGCVAHCNLTAQGSRLSNYTLQRSFFFFARMSCSEQSVFHGQASDRAWFFSELLFQSVAAKRKKKFSAPRRHALVAPRSHVFIYYPLKSKLSHVFSFHRLRFLDVPVLGNALRRFRNLWLNKLEQIFLCNGRNTNRPRIARHCQTVTKHLHD